MIPKKELERLFRQYYTPLVTLAFRLLGDHEEARDAVCDLFVAVGEGKLAPKDQQWLPYLHICLRNRCIDHMRHQEVQIQMARLWPLTHDAFTETDTARQRELEDRLMHYAEQHLSPQAFSILRLRFDEGLPYRLIGERLGITAPAVQQQLARALLKLKQYVTKEL